MNFEDLKNKLKRKFRSFHIGTLGAAVCTAQLLLELYSFALSLFFLNGASDISSIIFLVINCVFDLYLVRYFITAKENNSLAPARVGIIFLIISNYVIPAIRMVIESVFTNSLGISLFSIVLSGMVLGVIYFILLILEFNHKGKHNHLIMAIVSGLMVLFAIGQGALLIVLGSFGMINSANLLLDSLYLIYYILSAFVVVGTSLIFFLYPIFAIREQKRGF